MVDALAAAEAAVTAFTLVAIVLGRRAIRARDIPRHRAWMLSASAASAVFLALFVIRFVSYGPTPFEGEGAWLVLFRIVYFAHEPPAVANVVLVIAALLLAFRKKWSLHREVVSMAYPVWVFVAVTGLVLWWMLYFPRLLG